jgi:hypothetical protein
LSKDFKDRVLSILRDKHGVDEDFVAGQLATVISGRTIRREYGFNRDGERVMTKEVEIFKPKDVAAGVMIYDHLVGGELGLVNRISKTTDHEAKKLYEKFSPVGDERIIHGRRTIDVKDDS